MDIRRLHYLLFKAEHGIISEEEQKEIEAWYASVRDDDRELDFSEEEREDVRLRLWQKVKGGIQDSAYTDEERAYRPSISGKPRWYLLAASVVLLCLFGYWYSGGLELFSKKSSLLTVVTATGEHKNFQLSDGSIIWLGPESSLTYPVVFTDSLREVKLEGEAFFEVSPDASKPFLVSSGKVKTRVLGTSFRVQTFEKQEDVEVTVVSGKVSVYDEKGQFSEKLSADQRLSFINGSTTVVNYPGASEESLSRQKGNLIYDGKSVLQVLDDLRRYENAAIRIDGDVAFCTYYGTYTVGDNPEEFLKELTYLIRGTLKKNGEEFVIKAEGCQK